MNFSQILPSQETSAQECFRAGWNSQPIVCEVLYAQAHVCQWEFLSWSMYAPQEVKDQNEI